MREAVKNLIVALIHRALVTLVLALPVMLLWNYAAVATFALRELGFLHTWALLGLGGLLVNIIRPPDGA